LRIAVEYGHKGVLYTADYVFWKKRGHCHGARED
jgi:hypothetical protein